MPLRDCSSRPSADESKRKAGSPWKPSSPPFLSFCAPLLRLSISILLSENCPHLTRWGSKGDAVKASFKGGEDGFHGYFDESDSVDTKDSL